MSDAEHEDILELIPAYALNSLDSDEAALVSRHLSGCALCQTELSAYEAVVDVLPLAAPDSRPSSDLKGRLMAQVKSEPEPATAVTPTSSKPERSWGQQLSEAFQNLLTGPRQRGPRWRPVAWSAALLIVVALLVGNALQWRQANTPDPNSWRRVRLTGSEIAPDANSVRSR